MALELETVPVMKEISILYNEIEPITFKSVKMAKALKYSLKPRSCLCCRGKA